jgi:pimeloyl-ACP methyl ester carboxylesterase
MQWRKTVITGGAAIGAVATFNAVVRRGVAPPASFIGGEERWFDWHGHRVFYTRRGSGTPLLLVHSIHVAASSFEWRSNVDALAESHTVYTIDLLGFGCSDRPDVRYSARLYLHLIDDFARYVIGAPCTLIASSLSAAYAAVLGARDPGRYPALVLICPTGLSRGHEPAGAGGDFTRLVVDAPVVGTAVFNTLVSRASLRRFLERAYADDSLVTEELIDIYFAAAHQPGARFAPAAFLSEHLNIDVRGAMRRLTQPLLLVWGEQAEEVLVEDVRGFLALKPDLELAIFDPAGSLPHDERSGEFNRLVAEFVGGVGEPARKEERTAG